jgi:hypothetical protein
MSEDNDEKTTSTIIKADPGWFVALLVEAGRGFWEFEYFPILAWDIERTEHLRSDGELSVGHHTMPLILSEGNLESVANAWCIKRPDGMFEKVSGVVFATEAEAIEKLEQHRRGGRK